MRYTLFLILLLLLAGCAGGQKMSIMPAPDEIGDWAVVQGADFSTRPWTTSKKTGDRIDLSKHCRAVRVRIAVLDRDCPVGEAWPPADAKITRVTAPKDGAIPGAIGKCVGVQQVAGLCLAGVRESAGDQWWVKGARWCPMDRGGCSPQDDFVGRFE
jgi:hypothetical protein